MFKKNKERKKIMANKNDFAVTEWSGDHPFEPQHPTSAEKCM